MLSPGQGGLEQSLLDYCEAIASEGEEVVALVHPDWPGIAKLQRLGIGVVALRSMGEWDPLATARLRRLVSAHAPDVVVSIGRRASLLLRRALIRQSGPAHVAVTPNYSLAHLVGLDHVLTPTEDLKRALVDAGHPETRVSVVPFLIQLPDPPAAPPGRTDGVPIIGALGRFVAKKGFADLIDALALLRTQGHRFTARLGGDGPEAMALRARVADHGLADRVEFLGWVADRRRFFEAIDIFCVPSLHEPFGIVVLEGLAHGRPTVLTDAEGPREIITDGRDGLIVPRGQPERLSAALTRLLDQPDLRRRLATAGLDLVRERYALPVVARRISSVLRAVAARPQPTEAVSG